MLERNLGIFAGKIFYLLLFDHMMLEMVLKKLNRDLIFMTQKFNSFMGVKPCEFCELTVS